MMTRVSGKWLFLITVCIAVIMPFATQSTSYDFESSYENQEHEWYAKMIRAINVAYHCAQQAQKIVIDNQPRETLSIMLDASIGNGAYAYWCAQNLAQISQRTIRLEILQFCQNRLVSLSSVLAALLPHHVDIHRSVHWNALHTDIHQVINDIIARVDKNDFDQVDNLTIQDQDLN